MLPDFEQVAFCVKENCGAHLYVGNLTQQAEYYLPAFYSYQLHIEDGQSPRGRRQAGIVVINSV